MISLNNVGNFLMVVGGVFVFLSFTGIAYAVGMTSDTFFFGGVLVFVAGFLVRILLSLRGDFLRGQGKSSLFWFRIVTNSLLLFGLATFFFSLFLPTGLFHVYIITERSRVFAFFVFVLGLCLRIFVAIRRASMVEEDGREYVFWRNSLMFSLPVWLGEVWLVGFGLSGSNYSNYQRNLEFAIIQLPLLVAVVCLFLGIILKKSDKVALAIKILIVPFILAVLSMGLIVFLTSIKVFI